MTIHKYCRILKNLPELNEFSGIIGFNYFKTDIHPIYLNE